METIKIDVTARRQEEYVSTVEMPKELYEQYKDNDKFWEYVADTYVLKPQHWLYADDADEAHITIEDTQGDGSNNSAMTMNDINYFKSIIDE